MIGEAPSDVSSSEQSQSVAGRPAEIRSRRSHAGACSSSLSSRHSRLLARTVWPAWQSDRRMDSKQSQGITAARGGLWSAAQVRNILRVTDPASCHPTVDLSAKHNKIDRFCSAPPSRAFHILTEAYPAFAK